MNFDGEDTKHEIPTTKLLGAANPGKNPTVLIACGSFNPITHMHLRMFELCRENLCPDNHVIGMYLSPVSSFYNKDQLLDAEHRLNMCKLATENTDIMVDEWECQQPTYTKTLNVLEHFSRGFVRLFKFCPKIYLVCGSDLLKTFMIADIWSRADVDTILRCYGVAVVQRGDDNVEEIINHSEILRRYSHNIRVIVPWIKDEISSTKLRWAIRNKLSIRYITTDSVIDYIRKHQLYAL